LPLFYASYPDSLELKNLLVFCLVGSKDALSLAVFFISITELAVKPHDFATFLLIKRYLRQRV
jgi:hypothetical protein